MGVQPLPLDLFAELGVSLYPKVVTVSCLMHAQLEIWDWSAATTSPSSPSSVSQGCSGKKFIDI